MKKSKFARFVKGMLCTVLAFSLCGCTTTPHSEGNTPPEPDGPHRDLGDLEGVLGDTIYFDGDTLTLKSGNAFLRFPEASGSYGIELVDAEKDGLAVCENPVTVTVASYNGFGYDEKTYENKYTQLASHDNLLAANAMFTTDNGSKFSVIDTFDFAGDSILISRSLRILSAGAGDDGYNSRIAFRSCIDGDGIGDYTDCSYFIPGILYKDNQNMALGSIGSSFRVKSIQVKETRTGLPMAMFYNNATGATVSVAHYNPQISSPDERNYNAATVSDEFKVGSVGILRDPSPAVCFTYPNYETQGYVVNTSATKRFADIKGNGTDYTVSVCTFKSNDYNDAAVRSYEEQFSHYSDNIADVNLSALYDASIEDLKQLFCQDSSGACGVPFATYVDNGENLAVSYEIGFIGMQTSLAYQMMRYGIKKSDSESFDNGIKIINYWANSAPLDSGVIKIWGHPGGGFSSLPCYLRTMTDGAEGVLDAIRLIRQTQSDADISLWEEMVNNYADFLVKAQNADGSFYRAYDYGGNLFNANNPYNQKEEATTLADSKLNTPSVVRFLVRMYEFSGEAKYLDAATKAGNYIVENICPDGKFVGGTPDNANTCDREAGIYALYAFNALYSATEDGKWLGYAEQAAVFAVSWMYTYEFSVANPAGLLAGKAYEDGLVDGLSIIATGHSSVDTFMAYAYYELFKLWIWTGNDFFYDSALFTQNNTRQTVSLVNNLGYAFDSFAIEATDVSNFYFVTAETRGVWLPWITNANVEPYVNMLQTFGAGDILELKNMQQGELKALLKKYGAGGNAYGYIL